MRLTMLTLCVIMLSACVQVAPNLKLPEKVSCPKVEPVTCPTIPQHKLPPIANEVTIKIRGNQVEADAGGELLIREYAKAQQLLR